MASYIVEKRRVIMRIELYPEAKDALMGICHGVIRLFVDVLVADGGVAGGVHPGLFEPAAGFGGGCGTEMDYTWGHFCRHTDGIGKHLIDVSALADRSGPLVLR